MKDVHVRKVSDDIADTFNAAAGARNMTRPEYLAALVRLHKGLRPLVDGTDEPGRRLKEIQTLIEHLELGAVTR